MTNREIIDKAEPLLEAALAPLGIELVHIEYLKEQGRLVFRVFIDHADGVTHDTCRAASNVIGPVMEQNELITQFYYLEVSSPGLDRIIKKDKDFIRFAGSKIKVRTLEPIDGQKSFVGILKGLDNDGISLDMEGKTVVIPKAKTKQARLVIETQ